MQCNAIIRSTQFLSFCTNPNEINFTHNSHMQRIVRSKQFFGFCTKQNKTRFCLFYMVTIADGAVVNVRFPTLSGILALGYFIHMCISSILRTQINPQNNVSWKGKVSSPYHFCPVFFSRFILRSLSLRVQLWMGDIWGAGGQETYQSFSKFYTKFL